MKKIYVWATPFSMLLFFVIIMNLVYYYKLNGPTDFEICLNQIENQIKINDWSGARLVLKKAETAWQDLLPFIQFSTERDKMEAIEGHMARLNAALETENLDLSLGELYSVFQSWAYVTD